VSLRRRTLFTRVRFEFEQLSQFKSLACKPWQSFVLHPAYVSGKQAAKVQSYACKVHITYWHDQERHCDRFRIRKLPVRASPLYLRHCACRHYTKDDILRRSTLFSQRALKAVVPVHRTQYEALPKRPVTAGLSCLAHDRRHVQPKQDATKIFFPRNRWCEDDESPRAVRATARYAAH